MFTKKDLTAQLDTLNKLMNDNQVHITLIYSNRNGYHAVDYRYSQQGMNTLVVNEPPSVLADKATIFAYSHIISSLIKRVHNLTK